MQYALMQIPHYPPPLIWQCRLQVISHQWLLSHQPTDSSILPKCASHMWGPLAPRALSAATPLNQPPKVYLNIGQSEKLNYHRPEGLDQAALSVCNSDAENKSANCITKWIWILRMSIQYFSKTCKWKTILSPVFFTCYHLLLVINWSKLGLR